VKPPAFENKIRNPAELGAWLGMLPRRWCSPTACSTSCTAVTSPTWRRARALGAALLVAVNATHRCGALGKSGERPLNPLADRLAVVAGARGGAAVTWFDEDTPEALIDACRPEVLVKGGDWPVERIVGGAGVLARGGARAVDSVRARALDTDLLRRIRGG